MIWDAGCCRFSLQIQCPYQKFDCDQTGRSLTILSQWEINHFLAPQDWQKQWQDIGEGPLPP
jgi:hypothetical protein